MSWLTKLNRNDLSVNPGPTGGAGSNLVGISTFPGQGQLFNMPGRAPVKRRKKKRNGTNKKI